jgi:hypothetical protein
VDILPACIMFAYVEGESARNSQGEKEKRRKHTMIKAVNAVEALADFVECDPSEVEQFDLPYYGMEVFSVGNKRYAVGTDNEADEACKEYIKDTAWAFRSSFICEYCNLPQELAEALEAMQSKKCEGANDSILALIEKTDGGLDGFVEEAISADGRGHFLSSYDGNENEKDGFFIYRID